MLEAVKKMVPTEWLQRKSRDWKAAHEKLWTSSAGIDVFRNELGVRLDQVEDYLKNDEESSPRAFLEGMRDELREDALRTREFIAGARSGAYDLSPDEEERLLAQAGSWERGAHYIQGLVDDPNLFDSFFHEYDVILQKQEEEPRYFPEYEQRMSKLRQETGSMFGGTPVEIQADGFEHDTEDTHVALTSSTFTHSKDAWKAAHARRVARASRASENRTSGDYSEDALEIIPNSEFAREFNQVDKAYESHDLMGETAHSESKDEHVGESQEFEAQPPPEGESATDIATRLAVFEQESVMTHLTSLTGLGSFQKLLEKNITAFLDMNVAEGHTSEKLTEEEIADLEERYVERYMRNFVKGLERQLRFFSNAKTREYFYEDDMDRYALNLKDRILPKIHSAFLREIAKARKAGTDISAKDVVGFATNFLSKNFDQAVVDEGPPLLTGTKLNYVTRFVASRSFYHDIHASTSQLKKAYFAQHPHEALLAPHEDEDVLFMNCLLSPRGTTTTKERFLIESKIRAWMKKGDFAHDLLTVALSSLSEIHREALKDSGILAETGATSSLLGKMREFEEGSTELRLYLMNCVEYIDRLVLENSREGNHSVVDALQSLSSRFANLRSYYY